MLDNKQVIFGSSNCDKVRVYMWFMASTIEVYLDKIDWLDYARLSKN